MSNDTDFTLRFRHNKKKYLQQVQEYAEAKKVRWDGFKAKRGSNANTLMKRVGAKKPNEVVSWGFDFGTIQKEGNEYCLPATTFANQNASNVHITGEDGELADILAHFPELIIEGEYRDEYTGGSVYQTEQEEEYFRDDEGEDDEEDEEHLGDDDNADDEVVALTQAFAKKFIDSKEFFDLTEYSKIDDKAAKLFQAYLPADLDSVAGVERLRVGSVLGVLGVCFENAGDNKKALQCYENSVKLHADVSTGFWWDMAQLKSELGDDTLSKALNLYTDSFDAGTFSKYCKMLKQAIKECPTFPWAYNNLAWRLATSSIDRERDGAMAVDLATKARELCDYSGITGTLAAAYAEAGDFERAIKLQQQVVKLSPPWRIDDERAALKKYRAHEALRL